MNISGAANKGINLGSIVGFALAFAGLFLTGATFGTGAGLEGLIGSESFGQLLLDWTPQTPNILTTVSELTLGTLTGAAAGGATFATTHTITHSIPGVAKALGEPKHTKITHTHYQPKRGKGHAHPIAPYSPPPRESTFVQQLENELSEDALQADIYR